MIAAAKPWKKIGEPVNRVEPGQEEEQAGLPPQLLAPQHRLAQVGPVSFSHMKARLTSLDFP